MGQSYDLEMERRRLKAEAYRLRQESLENGDFASWQLARMFRDASTPSQIQRAKRRLEALERAAI